VVAKIGEKCGFADGLCGRMATDFRRFRIRGMERPPVGTIHFLSAASFSTGSKRAKARLANGELRRVHSDGYTTRPPAATVVASERTLAALIETAIPIESQGMRGGGTAALGEEPQDSGR